MDSGKSRFSAIPKPAPEFNGTARFSILRRLGAGGFGVVYHAYDRELNSPVALKVLHKTDAESLYAFKQEFRAIADITHTNLVALYELLSEQDQWFFTMELVEGMSFLEYIWQQPRSQPGNTPGEYPTIKLAPVSGRARSDAETIKLKEVMRTGGNSLTLLSLPKKSAGNQLIDIERLRLTLRQVAEGLHALHNAGKLHRDIKPSNILVTAQGRVVILDFGLVLEQIDQEGMRTVVGTPLYMSPEQCAGLPITAATDWYSLGIVLFEALTGQQPFTGSLIDILNNKQKFEPLAPAELVSGIPEDLDNLCWQLLRRDPQKRPRGAEILARLGKLRAGSRSMSGPLPALPRALPLIGRERHLSVLMEAFQATRQGQAITIYVQGRSGMGKSSLIRSFLEKVQQDESVVVLAGRCYEQESVPYKALDSLIDALSQYLKRLRPKQLTALLPRDILALAQLFPVLKQVGAVERAERSVLEIADSQERRRRGFIALRELFVRMADQPLILFIDDLQWGDIDSALLLAELLRPPDPPPLLLVGSYRSEEAATSQFLQQFFAAQTDHLPLNENTRTLVVDELSAGEARELALMLLGPVNSTSLAQADAIARESRGSPFFIDELVRYHQDAAESEAERVLIENVNSTGVSSTITAGSSNLATLDEVIYQRVTRLPKAARRLLEVLAVAGQPLERTLAKETAQLDSEEQNALVKLRSGHLIRFIDIDNEERLETYHDRIRETILAHLSAAARRELHQALAESFEATEQADPELLAVHYQGAAAPARAFGYAMMAATRAADALAFDRAAQLYRLAFKLQAECLILNARSHSSSDSPSDSSSDAAHKPLSAVEVEQLHIRLGEALANAGRADEAAREFLSAAAQIRQHHPAAADQAVKLQQRAAEQFLRGGNIDDGLAVFRDLLGKLGLGLIRSRHLALISLLIKRLQIRLRGLQFTERAADQIDAAELLRIDTFWSVAMGLGIVDTIRGTEFQARHLLLALAAGEPYRISRAISCESGYCALDGGRNQRRAEQLVEFSLALARRINHPHALALATLMAGLAAYCLGQFKRARELTETAESMIRERASEFAYELDIAQLFLLRSMFYRGELAELTARLPGLLKDAHERGDLYAATNLTTRVSYVGYLIADQADDGRKAVRQALMQWSQQGFYMQHFFSLVAQTEIALYCGDYRIGWDLLNAQWPDLSGSLILNIQVLAIESYHLRARSALAAATVAVNGRSLLKRAEQDAARIEREKMTYGNAFAHLIRAGIAATRHERVSAIELLAQAEQEFEQADMALYGIAARRRRGQLLGGEAGGALVIAADHWMMAEKIKHPAAMTNMLAPGSWPVMS